MLKQLTEQDILQLFGQIAQKHKLMVPETLADGTRALLPWNDHQVELHGQPLQRKPTCHFFPQTDPLVQLYEDGTVKLSTKADKPLALFGLGREDLHGIEFIDRFFAAEPADDIYLSKRRNAKLIGLTGYAGPNREFLPLAGQYCDIELITDKYQWFAAAYSDAGRQLLKHYPDANPQQLALMQEKSQKIITGQDKKIAEAAQLLQHKRVPDDFWEEISKRCIRCGGCNFTCPTCTCFCLQDRHTTTATDRSRIWDSCQLDAFMREASGHNPLGTDMLRTRRRIHHKLVDDFQRWGELGCILCGRCDRACPTGIGMYTICDEIISRFGDSV